MPIRRIVDRLVLSPSRHALPAPGKRRRLVLLGDSYVEVWVERPHAKKLIVPGEANGNEPTPAAESEPQAYILKFPGTAGRAERATIHPLDLWPEADVEIWHINPPGYGGSPGAATLVGLRSAASAVFQEVAREAGVRPIVLAGNSLGCVPALWLAAEHGPRVAGLLLRNPPPLLALIGEHYSPRSLRPLARILAGRVPQGLDAVATAARSTQPGVFVMSSRDSLVPPHMQSRIHEAYSGEKRIVSLAEADHADPVGPADLAAYREALHWLYEKTLLPGNREDRIILPASQSN